MKPSIGRIVHYVATNDHYEPLTTQPGKHLPAVVIETDGESCGLCVFSHGQTFWRGPTRHDEGAALGTWHWPEREE